MNEDSVEINTNDEVNKEQLDLENVFEDVEIQLRKVGDNFIDTIFEVMNGKRHKSYTEFINQMEERGFCMKNFENEIEKYSNYFKIGMAKNKKKIYDITSIDSDVHKTIDEQIYAVYQLNDTVEILMPKLKEQIVLLVNDFDQRLWGFNRFKDMITVLFDKKLEIIERGNSQFIRYLM